MHAARGGNLVEARELTFWGHQHAHNPRWLRSLDRCERAHRPAGKSRLFCSTYWHEQLGADPEDKQHHNFLPGERGSNHSVLHSLSKDHEGHLWWLRWRTLPGWVQMSDFKAERAKARPSCVLASPPLQGWVVLNEKNESCMYCYTMAEEEHMVAEVMNLLEAVPSSGPAGGVVADLLPLDLTFQLFVSSWLCWCQRAKAMMPSECSWRTSRWSAFQTKTLRNTTRGTEHTWARRQLTAWSTASFSCGQSGWNGR